MEGDSQRWRQSDRDRGVGERDKDRKVERKREEGRKKKKFFVIKDCWNFLFLCDSLVLNRFF